MATGCACTASAMACRFEVMLASDDAGDMAAAREALDEADDDRVGTDRVPRHERGHRAESPRRPRGACRSAPRSSRCCARSAELHAATGGAFDVTSTPLSRCWGFLRREGRLPTDAEIDAARARRRHAARRASTRRRAACRFAQRGRRGELRRDRQGLRARSDGRAAARARRAPRAALGRARAACSRSAGAGAAGRSICGRGSRAGASAGCGCANAAVGTSGAGRTVRRGRRPALRPRHRSAQRAARRTACSAPASSRATRRSADALSTAFLIGGPELAQRYCDAPARHAGGAGARRARRTAPKCSAATAARHWRC